MDRNQKRESEIKMIDTSGKAQRDLGLKSPAQSANSTAKHEAEIVGVYAQRHRAFAAAMVADMADGDFQQLMTMRQTRIDIEQLERQMKDISGQIQTKRAKLGSMKDQFR